MSLLFHSYMPLLDPSVHLIDFLDQIAHLLIHPISLVHLFTEDVHPHRRCRGRLCCANIPSDEPEPAWLDARLPRPGKTSTRWLQF